MCEREQSEMSQEESIAELQRSRLEIASRLVWCSNTCSSLEDVLYIFENVHSAAVEWNVLYIST